jgi:hypothetical protein
MVVCVVLNSHTFKERGVRATAICAYYIVAAPGTVIVLGSDCLVTPESYKHQRQGKVQEYYKNQERNSELLAGLFCRGN